MKKSIIKLTLVLVTVFCCILTNLNSSNNVNAISSVIGTSEVESNEATLYTNVNETEKNIVANNWNELANIINSDVYTYNKEEDILYRNVLNITLKANENWNADKNIVISSWQKIVLIPEEGKEVLVKRDANFTGSFITNNGTLSLGKDDMDGTFIFDGNGDEVEATNSLLEVSNGILNMNKNVTIKNNNAKTNGGGISINSSTIVISNSQIIDNKANLGGGIYVADASSNVELNNVKIEGNTATLYSGGGIYAYGNLIISGDETSISNNIAQTYGGGVMIKTKATINAGKISNNKALQNSGGGIRVDGELILNGGTITENYAKENGGGMDYQARKNDL